MSTEPNAPVRSIVEQHRALLAALPFSDTRDFDDASRGLLGRLDPCVVRADDGRVVWDNQSYAFLRRDAPRTVNPSLWRLSTLVAQHGL